MDPRKWLKKHLLPVTSKYMKYCTERCHHDTMGTLQLLLSDQVSSWINQNSVLPPGALLTCSDGRVVRNNVLTEMHDACRLDDLCYYQVVDVSLDATVLFTSFPNHPNGDMVLSKIKVYHLVKESQGMPWLCCCRQVMGGAPSIWMLCGGSARKSKQNTG